MKKILYCASTASHINAFHLPYIKYFKENGFKVDCAAAGNDIEDADTFYNVPFKRSLFSLSNIKAWFKMRALLKRGSYDIISTHTALAGFLTRSALFGIKGKSLVVHTSHGYIFGRNNDFKESLYLFAEKLCAPITDLLMVMNHEDTELAKKNKLCKKIRYIPGMGYDSKRFFYDRQKSEDGKKVIVYAGEFVKNKNHTELIDAFEKVAKDHPEAALVLAGEGRELEAIKRYAAEKKSGQKIIFPGYVHNMPEILKSAAVYCSPSLREGLPFNIMEAMASGVPVVASAIKGHTDLIKDKICGLLYKSGDIDSLAEALSFLLKDEDSAREYSMCALEKVQIFEIEEAYKKITSLYSEIIKKIQHTA